MLKRYFNELQLHKLVLLKDLELALSVALLCACSKLIDPRAIKCLEKTWIYYPALHLRSWELQERKKPQHGFALHWRESTLAKTEIIYTKIVGGKVFSNEFHIR